jgi:hypothetical protein
MTVVRGLVAVGLLAMAAGCGQGIKAASDYDRRVNFQNYNTYFFMKGNSTGDTSVDANLTGEVGNALLDRGWIQVPEGEGRAAVIVNTATDREHTYPKFFDGWGGWRARWDAAPAPRGFVEDYPVGAVVVTIFDADSKQAIWRGFAADAIRKDPKKGLEARDAAVTKLFESFPAAPYISMIPVFPDTATPEPADQPRILFSPLPAVLVRIDGEPKYKNVEGTSLEQVANTTALILRDDTGAHYLRILDGWMQSYSLTGSWEVTTVAPEGADAVLKRATASNDSRLDLLNDPSARRELTGLRLTDRPPAVFVSTTPAQLLITDGAPQFADMPGTTLRYAVNTTAKLFKEPTDQELYVLLADRWYRSWQPEGPWRLVGAADLPKDLLTASSR